MAVTADERAVAAAASPPPPRTIRRHWTRLILPTYSALVMVYLVLPILIVVLYGFNRSNGTKVVFKWLGFSTAAYTQILDIPDLTTALTNSLVEAFVST